MLIQFLSFVLTAVKILGNIAIYLLCSWIMIKILQFIARKNKCLINTEIIRKSTTMRGGKKVCVMTAQAKQILMSAHKNINGCAQSVQGKIG